MKHILKRFAIFACIGVFVGLSTYTARASAQSNTCAAFPKLTLQATAPVEDDYYVWIKIKGKENTNAQPYIQTAAQTSCNQLGRANSTDTWNWTSGKSGRLAVPLKNGQQTFSLSINGGSAQIDKVLFTLDPYCTPEGDGQNCIERTMSVSITGLQNNDTVTGSKTIEAAVSGTGQSETTVEFILDGNKVSSQTKAPYCLASDPSANTCTGYDLSTLSNGKHSLTVRASDGLTSSEKTYSFTVNNPTVPGPETPIERERPTPETPPAPETPVEHEDDESVTDVVDNIVTDVTVGSGSSDPTTTVAPGSTTSDTEQEVSGNVQLTVSNDRELEEDSAVTYSVDGEVVARTRSSSPAAVIDTKKLTNGKKVVSATITNKNGEGETLASKVTVKNSPISSFVNTVRQNPAQASVIFVGSIAAIAFLGYGIFRFISYRKLVNRHHLHSYDYVKPQNIVLPEPVQKAAPGLAVAALAFVFVGYFYINQSAYAGEIGFAIETETGTMDVGYVAGSENDVDYVLLSYTAPADPVTPTQPPITAGTNYSKQYGYTWRPVRTGAGGNVSGVAAADDGTIVNRIDVYGGYILDPGASQWRQLVTRDSMPAEWLQPKMGGGLFEVAIAPSNSNRVYIQWKGNLFKSDNRGKTFTKTSYTPVAWDSNGSYARGFGDKMAVDPVNPDYVLAGAPSGNLRISYDGGTTWSNTSVPAGDNEPETESNEIPSVGHTGIAFDKTSGTVNGRTKVAYVNSWKRGVWRTTDGGATWSQISGGPNRVIHAGVDASGTYYAIDDHQGNSLKIFKYSNNNWTDISGPINDNFWGIADVENPYIAVSPHASGRIIAGHPTRTFQSTDGGATWQQIDIHSVSSDLAWQHADGGKNYYLVASDMTFSRSNPNELWMSFGESVQHGSIEPSNTKLDFAVLGRGMESMVSTRVVSVKSGPVFGVFDFGMFAGSSNLDDWSLKKGPISTFSGTQSLASSPFTDNFIVHVTSNYVSTTKPEDNNSGYSADGGATWTKFAKLPVGSAPVDFGYGSIAVSNPDNIVWAPGNHYSVGPKNAQPYYTKDRGQTWTPVNLPGVGNYPQNSIGGQMFGSNRQTVTADRVNPGTFYLQMVGQGVFRTTDGGTTWTKMYGANGGRIEGVDAFTSLMQAIPGQAGGLVYTDGPAGGHNYLGPQSHEGWPLKRSTDGGATWTSVPNVDKVQTFGFGKEAPGSPYATVYIAGNVGGAYGIWRSTDDMNSWVQIGDYPYLIDWVTTISGDVNEYGKVYVGLGGSSYVYGVIE